jgi:ABC-type antimicrobial peptide transport system permease subunit
VGIFGVVAYAVRSRRSEFGVRLALGATPGKLKRDVMFGALPVLLSGIGIGVLAGVAAARGARAVLYDVSPLDPLSLVLAVLAVYGTGLLATYLPAGRVTRIDPTEAIRSD